jgi:hypothetical protein
VQPMSELRIHTTPARLGIHSTNAELKLDLNSQVKANLQASLGDLRLKQQFSKIEVNWEQVNAERGLKNLTYSRQELISKSRQAALDAIAISAQEGDFYSDQPYRGAGISSWARNSMMEQPPELNVKAIPEVNSLGIEFSPYAVKVDHSDTEVSVNPEQMIREISASRANVDIYDIQKVKVDITYMKGKKLDYYT